MQKSIIKGIWATVLGTTFGLMIGTSANAYTSLGCTYAPGTINPISFRFYSVGDSSLVTSTKYGVGAWNSTSAPGNFQETTTSLDPEVNVTDDSYPTDGFYAKVFFTCINGHFSGNEVNLIWNNPKVGTRTLSQKYRIATHELGHAYGLDHLNSGCHIMRYDVGFMTDCLRSTPSSDDVAGATALN